MSTPAPRVSRNLMVLVPQSRSVLLAEHPAKQNWLAAGLCLAMVALALCLLFAHETAAAYRVWMESTAYNHCFLILPVALYLAWQKRGLMERASPQPDLRALALLLPLLLLWLVAALVNVLEVQQLTVVAMFQVIAIAVLGWTAYRALLMPFLYLFFLVPTGYFLVPSLQDFTAWFAIAGLKLVGIPVFSDGTLIDVPAGSFVVAEACAGLRFLIASLAFGVFFATLVYRSRVRWLVFVALSVVVPIIANGLRAFGIIAASEWIGNAAAVEADHLIYGWVFFSAVTLLLIVIGLRFADDRTPGPERPAPIVGLAPARAWSVPLAAFIGLALAATGPAYAQFSDWRGAVSSLANAPLPPLPAGWSPVVSGVPLWRPLVQHPDREMVDAFSDGARIVVRYVALYQAEGFHNNLVRGTTDIADDVHWHRSTYTQAHAEIDGRDTMVGATEITNGESKLLVWHFYVVDGVVAVSPFQAKLVQLRGLFRFNDHVDAFVAVATEETGREPPAQVLQRFLGAMGPLSAYVGALKPR
jgi:exosortase A